MPKVSVILTAYNREAMVGAAIDSLLVQTFDDFEIIVVDDGSTDRSVEVVKSMRDPRVRLITHERNLGIPSARNSGLEAAEGQYIAWLDSDDLARPKRLALQAAYLDSHPSIAMVGASAGTIRPSGRHSWMPRPRPTSHEQIVSMLQFRTSMLQSSIMGRAEILKQYPYRLEFPVCQDLDMFIRLTRDHRVANLPQVLVDRRCHEGQVVRQRAAKIVDRKRVLFRESLGRLGIEPSDEDLDRHILLGRINKSPISREFLEWSHAWLEGIAGANCSRGIYDARGLDYTLKRVWQRACAAALRGPDRVYAATHFWSSRAS